MKKISISIKNEVMIFSEYKKEINKEDLNNTNIIDMKNLKFSEEYILINLEIVTTFLNLIALREKVNTVYINDSSISSTVLKIILTIKNIEKIKFLENDMLSYTVCSMLLENKDLKEIECYNLPEVMYYRFPNQVVKTRCRIPCTSEFMQSNSINTYSDLCSKTKIIITKNLLFYDSLDLEYIIQNNKIFKKIELFNYKRDDLKAVLELLKQNGINKKIITIYENTENTNLVLHDISLFRELEKKYDVDIQIKYSKEYRDKNRWKQLNIAMLKWITLGVIVFSIGVFFVSKYTEYKNMKNIKENEKKIQDLVEDTIDEIKIVDMVIDSKKEESNDNESTEVVDQYVSPYYSNYEKTYQKLLQINSDTVGWLTVPNTNIDYPVVQTSDNKYYLNHAFDKSNNPVGWIFADYRNKFDGSDKNIIIYGHRVGNMNIMFSTLQNVLDTSWHQNESNLDITFRIKDENITWRIFSIYTIDKTSDYLKTEFKTPFDFLDFATMITNRSMIDFNTNLIESDQILTLSTCYQNNEHRLVIHAKRLD